MHNPQVEIIVLCIYFPISLVLIFVYTWIICLLCAYTILTIKNLAFALWVLLWVLEYISGGWEHQLCVCILWTHLHECFILFSR